MNTQTGLNQSICDRSWPYFYEHSKRTMALAKFDWMEGLVELLLVYK